MGEILEILLHHDVFGIRYQAENGVSKLPLCRETLLFRKHWQF
jgi:hypothetical protein